MLITVKIVSRNFFRTSLLEDISNKISHIFLYKFFEYMYFKIMRDTSQSSLMRDSEVGVLWFWDNINTYIYIFPFRYHSLRILVELFVRDTLSHFYLLFFFTFSNFSFFVLLFIAEKLYEKTTNVGALRLSVLSCYFSFHSIWFTL